MFRLLLRFKRFIRARFGINRRFDRNGQLPRGFGFKVLGILLATVAITALNPPAAYYMPISVPKLGDIAPEDIVAPFDFPVEKSPEALAQEIRESVREVPLVLDFNEFTYDSVVTTIDSMIAATRTLKQSSSQMSHKIRRLSLLFPELTRKTASNLLQLDSIRLYRNGILKAVKELYMAGVLEDSTQLYDGEYQRVAVVRAGGRTILRPDQIATLAQAGELLTKSFELPDSNVASMLGLAVAGFIRPSLTVNFAQTEREKTIAAAQVPRDDITFKAGDVIIRRNHKVAPVHLKWLEAMAKHRVRTGENTSLWLLTLPVLSRAVFICFLLSVFTAMLFFFKRRETFSNPHFAAVLVIILIQIALNYLIGVELGLSFYLIPFVISSLLFAILFDLEVGLLATFVISILAGILSRFDFSYTFVNVVVGSVACFSVRVVRQRSDFYRSVLYIAVTYILVIYLLESLKFSETSVIVEAFGFGVVNAVLSPILVMGFLPVFESLFNLSTDITLLELSDMNHPLLRRLALEAPGTYHHSIIVGNLSEKAAEAIGANTLLARVGAYYHDIGKMEIAEYFIENQTGIRNRHEKLTPSMSALIIGSHVKKGVDLATHFDLPDRIVDFIEEHHGTTLMSYFYSKAKESTDENELNEDDFRYPGPKPNSRETAIVMLADSVEAASRTLEDPKPSRIRNVIKRIITDKFQAGELSHSALTMHDLGLIEDSFVNMLIGVFHARIDYPQEEEESKA
jgi:putative nucleotidyltransferase with HDIG domain